MEVQMAKKYRVTQKVGPYRVGQIVDDSTRYVRRKIAEGGCMEEVKNAGPAPANKAVESAPENKERKEKGRDK
jgi:hypothetical protein